MTDFDHLQAIVFAHPDGIAHKKACSECAFRRSNPQALTEDDFDWMLQQREMAGFTFYCNHRVTDGYSRECACWAAMEKGRAHPARPVAVRCAAALRFPMRRPHE